jgi:hypothetical protein
MCGQWRAGYETATEMPREGLREDFNNCIDPAYPSKHEEGVEDTAEGGEGGERITRHWRMNTYHDGACCAGYATRRGLAPAASVMDSIHDDLHRAGEWYL